MTASKGTMQGRDKVLRKFFDTKLSRMARADLASDFDNWRNASYGDFDWMLVEEHGVEGTTLVLGKPLTHYENKRVVWEICHKDWKAPIRVTSAVNAPEPYKVSFESEIVPMLAKLGEVSDRMAHLYHVAFPDRLGSDVIEPMTSDTMVSGIETGGKLIFSPSEADARIIAEVLARSLGHDPKEAVILRIDRKNAGEIFDTPTGTSWSYSAIPAFRFEEPIDDHWLPIASRPADFDETPGAPMPKSLAWRMLEKLMPTR